MSIQEIEEERVKGWRELDLVKDLVFLHGPGPIAGTQRVEAIYPAWGVPVGMAYYKLTYDQRVSLDYINVVEQLRKLGIGRAIIESILKDQNCEILVTSTATDLAKPFLLKLNFAEPAAGRPYWIRGAKF